MKGEVPTITTDRYLLRRITPDDQENIFRGLSDPDVVRFYGISFENSESASEQMSWYADLERSGTGIWWSICDKEDMTFLGAAGLNDISRTHRKGEIGFWLFPENWGKGIMKEVIPEICDYGFKTIGLHRIEGFVESENINCKRAFEKVNFTYEGTMKECELKNGKFISIDIYSLLSSK